jgi:sugar phosphate isomerase/epimerase
VSISRRKFLAQAALAAATPAWLSSRAAPAVSRRSDLGVVTYAFLLHQKASKGAKQGLDYNDPLGYLEACHRAGAGGVQFPFGERSARYAGQFRRRAERLAMRVEAIVTLPKDETELPRFEQQVLCAMQSGATVARTTMLPGRRYEEFKTRAAFETACAQGLHSLQLAEPIAARHRLRLALENHKDHLVAEKLEVLKQISSQYVGLCVDVSNNFALCEDPVETVRAFAPWAFTVHFKDQALQECEDGFWLMDVALGEGFLPLKQFVQDLRRAKPNLHFSLEVITRDPIKVPVRVDSYWATFPGRPRTDAEPMLRLAKEKGKPLPLVSSLSPERQLSLEQSNIEKSIAYARDELGL